MGDQFPNNYAAKAAYAAYRESMELSDEDNNMDDWDELLSEERDAWIASAEAAYTAERHRLSDQ